MNELKPEDVMKALECCIESGYFIDCFLKEFEGISVDYVLKSALALLREKDAEIERLNAENGILKKRLDEAETNIELLEDAVGDVSDDEVEQLEKLLAMERADAITEFAERAKRRLPIVSPSVFDKIAKEMKGVTDERKEI